MRGFKLNNPGNLRISDATWIGKVPSADSEFEQFGTLNDGLRAMMLNIKNKKDLHGIETLGDLINNYAPPTENDTNNYIQFVADKTGLDPNARLDFSDKSVLVPLTKAMVEMEQGKNLIPDEVYDYAAERAISGGEEAALDFSNLADPIDDSGLQGEQQANDPIGGGFQDGKRVLTPDSPEVSWDPVKNDYVFPADATLDLSGVKVLPNGKQPLRRDEPLSKDFRDFDPENESMAGYVAKGLANYGRGIIDETAQGIPFFDELLYVPDRLISGKEKADARRENYLNRLDDFSEENPGTTIASQGTGLLLSGGAIKKGLQTVGAKVAPQMTEKAGIALTEFAKSHPYLFSAGVGAGGGALYSAGQAEGDVSERLDDAGSGAFWGGLAGPVGTKLVKTGSNLVKAGGELIKEKAPGIVGMLDDFMPKAANAVDDLGDDVANAVDNPIDAPQSFTPASMLDDEALARLDEGKVLRMTRGDRTQNPDLQSLEDQALRLGDPNMVAARSAQQDDAYRAFENSLGGGILGTQDDLAQKGLNDIAQANKAAEVIRAEYDSLGNQVNAAYKTAREGADGVSISAQAIKDGFVNRVDEVLNSEYYRRGEISAMDDALDEIRDMMNPKGDQPFKVTAAKLQELEAWKKRYNRNVVGELETNADKSRIAKYIGRQYDEFLTNLADDAIIGGDESAINAFKTARSLAKQKFAFYESDKTIARILDQRDLNGQQLANIVFGAGKLAGKGEDGRIVETMIKHAGARAPEMQEALKRGMMARMLERSMSKTLDPVKAGQGIDRNLLSFPKLVDNLGELVNKQPEAFKAVFSESEQEFLKTLLKESRQLASKQPGAQNLSNSWIQFAKYLNKVPMIGHTPIGSGLQKLATVHAEYAVRGKVSKGLEEFIETQINAINAPPSYYGALAGGGGSQIYFENTKGE